MHAKYALESLIEHYRFQTVLDIGAGNGSAGKKFEKAGKTVTSIDISDFGAPNLIVGDYLSIKGLPKFDLIWASHVLEHQPNVGLFLNKCYDDLKEFGLLCISVPPLKHEIVGGHLTLWNAGLLCYNLILAGFDCELAAIKTSGYNISIICKKHPSPLPKLKYDNGDIETLADRFPRGYQYHGFNGQISEYCWK